MSVAGAKGSRTPDLLNAIQVPGESTRNQSQTSFFNSIEVRPLNKSCPFAFLMVFRTLRLEALWKQEGAQLQANEWISA